MVIALQEVKVTADLEKFAATVLPLDLQRTIQIVFLNEVQQMRRSGREPTTILIDNGTRQLINVKRRAQAFFSDIGRLKEALKAAWRMLVGVTRIASGAARRSYALYLNGTPAGGENDIDAVVNKMVSGDRISIVGPGVAYGRKLYWRPFGKARKVKLKRKEYIREKGKAPQLGRTHYQEPMHRTVRRLLKKQYPEFAISDRWIELQHGGGKHGERWPALTISFKSSRKSAMELH